MKLFARPTDLPFFAIFTLVSLFSFVYSFAILLFWRKLISKFTYQMYLAVKSYGQNIGKKVAIVFQYVDKLLTNFSIDWFSFTVELTNGFLSLQTNACI